MHGCTGPQVAGLAGNRGALLDALSPLGGANIVGGEGAIYLFARLPEGEEALFCAFKSAWTARVASPGAAESSRRAGHCRLPPPPLAHAAPPLPHRPAGCEDDQAVVEWLVKKHKVCLIPGSSCGCPGHVRAAFANLRPEVCAEAAARLKAGLQELVGGGMAPVRQFLSQAQS